MSGWTCTACGGTNPAGFAFCGQCGTRGAAAPPTDEGGWTCRACAMRNTHAAVFCGGCGQPRVTARQEEQRLVTALFADISGFTSLAEVLDTEDLHDVVTPLVNGLTGIAERYGGFVEKFAGDALLAVFGVPATAPDDPQRALLAALEMHRALPDLLAPLGPAAGGLTIHVGVNTGRVIGRQIGTAQQSDYAVLGDSVILAQRLESVCPAGETYVGATTRDLCAEEFDFEDLPPLQLKGKAQPVQAYRLVAPRAPRLRPAPGALVGRRREQVELEDLLRDDGALLTVIGSAGVGKSALTAALESRAVGGTWWRARCLSYGSSLPYWPFADLLRRELGAEELEHDGVRAAVVAGLPEPAWHGALLLLAVEQGSDEPQVLRRTVHDAVAAWLADRLTAGRRVLLLEDVHWVDTASADLLRELVVRLPRLSVVLTSRPDVPSPLSGPRHREVVLEGVDATTVDGIAAAVLGGAPGPRLAELLLDRTGGNPLFVQQLSRSLVDAGALVRAGGAVELRPGADVEQVPTTVEQVLAARVDALPPAAAGLLQVASVVGRHVPLVLLREVAEAGALQELPRLVESGMLEPAGDAVAFSHALLQDVVHARLLRRRRRELHQRVADAARALYGDGDEVVGLLARHLYLAGAGAAAVDALLRAGRRAAALYANDEAALHLARAVELLGQDGEVPPGVALELAAVEELRGGYDAALALFRDVRLRTGDVVACEGEMRVLRARGRYDEALALHASLDGAALPLELERAATLINAGRHREAVTVLEAARAVDDGGGGAALLVHLARAHKLAGQLEEGLRAASEAVDRAGAAGDRREQGRALRVLGDVLVSLHRLDEAEGAWVRALQLARETATADEEAGLLLNLGYLELQRERFDAALAHNEQAVLAFERIGHGSGIAIGYGNLAWTVLQLGRAQECLQLCARATEQAISIGHLGTRADAAKTRALALAALDRAEEARTAAQEAAALFGELGDEDEQAACLRLAQADRRG